MSPSPGWLAPTYPLVVRCTFCGQDLTIRLRPRSTSTYTTGHAPSCVQVEVGRRQPATSSTSEAGR